LQRQNNISTIHQCLPALTTGTTKDATRPISTSRQIRVHIFSRERRLKTIFDVACRRCNALECSHTAIAVWRRGADEWTTNPYVDFLVVRTEHMIWLMCWSIAHHHR